MDPYRPRIWLSLGRHCDSKSLRIYGGDDGARTRDLCRDSRLETHNLLKSGGMDGHFRSPETRWRTLIGPLTDPRPLPSKPLPTPSRRPMFALLLRQNLDLCPVNFCLRSAEVVGPIGPFGPSRFIAKSLLPKELHSDSAKDPLRRRQWSSKL
jgi:hypothetical protein